MAFLVSNYEPLSVFLDVRHVHDAPHGILLHFLQTIVVAVVLIQDLLSFKGMPELKQMEKGSALSPMHLFVLSARGKDQFSELVVQVENILSDRREPES